MKNDDKENQIDLSIIIVAWNVKEMVEECLTALRRSEDSLKKEILFVDNASEDGTVEYIQECFPEVTLIQSPVNLGFIRANNLAYEQARGKYILMLNSDAFVFPETLSKTIQFMEETPDCGVVGPRLIGQDGVPQPSARFFPTPFKLFLRNLGLDGRLPFTGALDDLTMDHSRIQECDWVVGCFLLVRKAIIEEMDFFLRDDYFLYNDDNDLCLRVKKRGWKVHSYPTDVVHVGGASTKKMGEKRSGNEVEKFLMESDLIYFRKNYGIWTACSHFFFIIVFSMVLFLKKIILPKRTYSIWEPFARMSLAAKMLIGTRAGNRAVTRVAGCD